MGTTQEIDVPIKNVEIVIGITRGSTDSSVSSFAFTKKKKYGKVQFPIKGFFFSKDLLLKKTFFLAVNPFRKKIP
jgi:hypothetical protein